MIKRSIPRTSQPQDAPDIDKNNSLSGGLVFSWLAASGISPEQVRGVLPTSESGITRAPNRGGIGASVAVTGGINYALVPFIGIDKYTIAAVAAPPAAAARSHLYISGTETGTFPQYVLAVNSSNTGANASGKFALLEYDAGWKAQAESIVGMVDGGLHTFTAVRDGTTVRLYRDGIDVTGTLGTISGTHSKTTGNVSVGGNVGTTTRGGSFPILSVQAWSRALSVQSAVSHGINPWQIFAPQQRSIYVSVASGGVSVNVSPTGLSSTSSLGGFTVTGTSSVTLTGLSSTSGLGALTVTTGGSVNVNLSGLSSTSSLGSITATGTANVTLSGLSSTSSLGTISVTVGGAVNVNLSGQSSASSLGTLTVTGTGNVSPTGVVSISSIGSVTVVTNTGTPVSVSLTGLECTSSIGFALVWGNIDDSQTAGWGNINDSQTPGWTVIPT